MNSWGTGWGDGGFAKVPFVEDDVGYCGMYTQVYQPLA
jgi:C1A family cysteine protease